MPEINRALVKDILDSFTYYNDVQDESSCYVEYKMATGEKLFEPLDSKMFAAYVKELYRLETDEYVDFSLRPFLNIRRQGLMVNGDRKVKICHRLTGSIASQEIQYFLADDMRNIFYISPDEIGFLQENSGTDVRFLKKTADQPQVVPEDSDRDLFTLLRPYVNLGDEDFLLFVINLVHFFSRNASHYGMIFSSDKGSGKSTLSKLVRRLIDPSRETVTVMANSESDLQVTLADSYLVVMDNTDTLSARFADLLCSAITGASASKRKLYTDSDKVILDLYNALIINGINVVPHRSDLAQRCLLFSLKPISDENRKTDEEFWDAFEADKPCILGAIFTTLQKAMQVYPSIDRNRRLSRMASANLEMLAVGEALGISAERCQGLIDANALAMEMSYASYNLFVDYVIEYFQSQNTRCIRKLASALHKEMYESIVGSRTFFPQNHSALSRKLNTESGTLALFGIRFYREESNHGTYLVLESIPKKSLTKDQKNMIAHRDALRNELAECNRMCRSFDGTEEPEEEVIPNEPVKKSGFKKLIPEKQQKDNWYDEEDTESAATDSASVDH